MSKQYIALLRGINVGGNTIMKMADLQAEFKSMGFNDVKTYIQTGNVIFSSGETDINNLKSKIEGYLRNNINYEKDVFILTPGELIEAVKHNPFEPEKHENERRCQLMFLSAEPDATNINKLMAMEGEEYQFSVWQKVFYYSYSKEFDGHARRAIDFEKVLGVSGTSRTWKVIDKLIKLSSA